MEKENFFFRSQRLRQKTTWTSWYTGRKFNGKTVVSSKEKPVYQEGTGTGEKRSPEEREDDCMLVDFDASAAEGGWGASGKGPEPAAENSRGVRFRFPWIGTREEAKIMRRGEWMVWDLLPLSGDGEPLWREHI